MKHKGLFWVIMGICVLIGCVMIAIGTAMGGRFDHMNARFMVNDEIWTSDHIEDHGISGDDQNLSTYTNIKNLDFDLAMGDVTIIEGDDFAISGSKINSKISDDGETWSLQSPKRKWYHWIGHHTGGNWEITIPKGRRFDRVDINFAAAEVDIDALSADDLRIKGGAGEADIDKLSVGKSMDLQIGAGTLKVSAGEIGGNCEIKCGAGSLEMALSHIDGDADVDCGMGTIHMNLPGSRREYNITSQSALGTVKIEEDDLDNQTDSGTTEIRANLDLKCGMGEIDVDFE